jgi:hypothetical protein
MVDTGVADVFAVERQQLRNRAALLTRLHTWRTAAVMTLFQSPLGLLFGLVALLLLRGLGRLIDGGREAEAAQKLRAARITVLIGAGVAALSLLVSGIFAFQMMQSFSAQMENVAKRASGNHD